jgi:DUF4097 and DUF4098 domain-containing protein YvlB
MGDLEVEKSYGEITIIDSTIKDDVELEENSGKITINNNTIGDDLEIEENTGGVSITNNVIFGDLECEENILHPPEVAIKLMVTEKVNVITWKLLMNGQINPG